MEIEIYADIVFFINFIMDFFIFWIVSKIIRRNISIKRILAASASAAFLYCILLFTSPINKGVNFFCSAATIIISVMICFKPKSAKELIKLVILTNISAFTVGGTGMAIFYYTNVGYYLGNMLSINNSHFSLKLLIFSSCGCYIIFRILINKYNKSALKKQSFCSVNLYFEKAKIELTALIDTGNSLHDPASDKPVIIAEFNSIKSVLPEKIRLLYYENNDSILSEMLKAIEESESKDIFTFIPFSSLGKNKGTLIAIKAIKAEIIGEIKTEITAPYVAIYNLTLSKSGEFNSLINPEIFKSKEV